MKASTIAKNIVEGEFTSEDINVIIEAIKTAQRIGRAKRSAVALTQMKIGAVGTLTGLTPKSLNGRKVKITGISRTRVIVQEVGSDSYDSKYTVPAQCVKL